MPEPTTSPRRRRAAAPDVQTTSDPRRVVVENARPLVDCGALPAKATVGLALEVSADLVADGHDLLMGRVSHGPATTDRAAGGNGRSPAASARETVVMTPLGNDR